MKLRAENLVKKYGVRTVVKGVSMEVNQGEIVGFLGPNGAGKTTSFYMITGQIVPNEGRIFIDDDELTGLPMYKRSQKGVGYLPQEASVFRQMSVEDNIMSVMEMTRMTKAEREARLEQLIDEFNLSKVRKSKGIQLSGGERRRCEIARALAVDPKFILLDEPFAGVDPIAVEDIQYIIAKLKYRNIGVIITDHNVGETLAITDRAYLLYEGTILQEGTPEELAADEDVRTKYLGSGFVLKRSKSVERARREAEAARAAASAPVISSEAEGGVEKSPISSTRIRKALAEGDVEAANAMLGYSYGLYGVVVAGNRMGRTIGFPTANMQLYEPLKLVPGDGVYAVDVEVTGNVFKGMCNIGTRPTVGGTSRTIETHILDFSEDIYGLPLRLRFLRRIRDERKFPSLDALRQQLVSDAESVYIM